MLREILSDVRLALATAICAVGAAGGILITLFAWLWDGRRKKMSESEMREIMEQQECVIEAQSYIIGELMRLYSTGADFHLSDELEQAIEAVRRAKRN